MLYCEFCADITCLSTVNLITFLSLKWLVFWITGNTTSAVVCSCQAWSCCVCGSFVLPLLQCLSLTVFDLLDIDFFGCYFIVVKVSCA